MNELLLARDIIGSKKKMIYLLRCKNEANLIHPLGLTGATVNLV